MKFIIILADDRVAEAVERLLDDEGLPGFTEIPQALGRGLHGKKTGTRAFPGSTNVFFTAVPATQLDPLLGDLKQIRNAAEHDEGLHVFALDAMELV